MAINFKRFIGNRSFSNMLWLIGDSLFRMGLGFFVTVWLARYMGPKGFGAFNYAYAVIAVYTSVASLGMNGVVVRDLIKQEAPASLIMGSSFYLQVLGSVLASILVLVTTYLLRPGESEVLWAVMLMVPSILFRSSDIFKYWFEAKVSSKFSVVAQNVGFLVSALLKICAIVLHAPYWVISLTVSIEIFIVSLMLVFLYRRERNVFDWKFDSSVAKSMFSQSWPLVLSGVALMLYMRIDQIMIGSMLGDAQVGVYSVAVKLSEVWYFLPIAIVSSFFPKVIEEKRKGNMVAYEQRMQFIYDVAVVAAVGLALVISVLSPWVIVYFYGSAYKGAIPVSVIYSWVGVFYFLSSVSGRWYINENLQMFALTRNLFGLAIGFLLNLVLIPRFGALGSVASTLVAFGGAAYFFDAFTKATRPAFRQKTRALWLPGAFVRLKAGFKGI